MIALVVLAPLAIYCLCVLLVGLTSRWTLTPWRDEESYD